MNGLQNIYCTEDYLSDFKNHYYVWNNLPSETNRDWPVFFISVLLNTFINLHVHCKAKTLKEYEEDYIFIFPSMF